MVVNFRRIRIDIIAQNLASRYFSGIYVEFLKKPIEYHPGHAVVPEDPGLGIEFDEKELKKVIAG